MCRRGFHANWGLVMVVKRLECYWKLDEEGGGGGGEEMGRARLRLLVCPCLGKFHLFMEIHMRLANQIPRVRCVHLH